LAFRQQLRRRSSEAEEICAGWAGKALNRKIGNLNSDWHTISHEPGATLGISTVACHSDDEIQPGADDFSVKAD
jgi:hypothetical protein